MDEIKVYWDEEKDYYFIINSNVLCGFSDDDGYFCGALDSDDFYCLLWSSTLELVYDSTEDHDEWEFSLIDENLMIPDVKDAVDMCFNDEHRWTFDDYMNWGCAVIVHLNTTRRTA